MPITVQEFEKGEAAEPEEPEDAFGAKAIKFLHAHRDQAFTLTEIAEGIGLLKPSPKGEVDPAREDPVLDFDRRSRLHGQLEFLAHQGRIRQNDVRRGKYIDVFWAAK